MKNQYYFGVHRFFERGFSTERPALARWFDRR
jgi:hypothetical protein